MEYTQSRTNINSQLSQNFKHDIINSREHSRFPEDGSYAIFGDLQLIEQQGTSTFCPAGSSYFENRQLPPSFQNYRQFNEQQLLPVRQEPLEICNPRPCGYFFESPSKYISLKKHKKENNFITSSQSSNTNAVTQRDSNEKPSEQRLKIKEWFEKLDISDKSIVLTVLDKQLVKLIYQMYITYSDEGYGEFTNSEYPDSNPDSYTRVKNFDLLFKKKRPSIFEAGDLKSIKDYHENLVHSVRLVSKTQSEIRVENKSSQKKGESLESKKKLKRNLSIDQYDAITLDIEYYQNSSFFFEMLELVNNNKPVLRQDLQLSEEASKLDNSVFYQRKEESNDLSYTRRRLNEASAQQLPKKHFTMIPSSQQFPMKMTLGQCLLTIFEKAINVQYYDYLGRLKSHHQSYFFLEEENFNMFQYDQRLSRYWINLSTDQKDKVVKKLDELECQLKLEEHKPVPIPKISESLFEEDQEENYSTEQEEDAYDDRSYGRGQKSSINKYDDEIDLEDQRYYKGSQKSNQKVSNYGSTQTQYFMDNEYNYQSREEFFFNQCFQVKPQVNQLQVTNKFQFEKAEIFKYLHKANKDVKQTFDFIKKLSTCVSLEIVRNKDNKVELKHRFYNYLLKQEEESGFNEIIGLEERNKSNPLALENHESEKTETNNIAQPDQNNGQQQTEKSSKNKKKKNKKKKKNATQTTNTLEIPQYDNQSSMMPLVTNNIPDLAQESIYDRIIRQKFEQEEEEYQRKKHQEERTSLLTGEVLTQKYSEEIEMQVITHQETKEQAQKRKKRKNKKNKNKKKGIDAQEQAAKAKQDQVIREVDEIESIQLEQIGLEVELDDDDNSKDEEKQKLELSADRKINNFIDEIDCDTKIESVETEVIFVSDYSKGNNDCLLPAIPKFKVDEVLNNQQQELKPLFQSQKISSPQVEEVKDEPKIQEQKMNNKKANKKNRKLQKEALKSAQSNKKKDINEIANKSKQEIMILNNENLMKLEKEEKKLKENAQEEETTNFSSKEKTKEKSKKVVGFRIPRDLDTDEEVKVPKRGSSRGSSCTEEVIHQNTINMLGDLFPTEYKNPTSDVKNKISEITCVTTNQIEDLPEVVKPQQKDKSFEIISSQNSKKQAQVSSRKPTKSTDNKNNVAASPNIQKTKSQKNIKKQSQFDNYEDMFQNAYEPNHKKPPPKKETKEKQPQQQKLQYQQKEKKPVLESPEKQQQRPKQTQELLKVIQQEKPISENMKIQKDNGSQKKPLQQKKTKTKILINQQQQQQKQLQPMPFDQRSQTPNIELLQTESLQVASNHAAQNHHRNNNAQTNKKDHKQQQQLKKTYSNKKKPLTSIQQQQNPYNPSIEQMIAFDQQQMQLQQQQQYMLQQQLYGVPFITPQFYLPFQQNQQLNAFTQDPNNKIENCEDDEQEHYEEDTQQQKTQRDKQTDDRQEYDIEDNKPQVVINNFQNINVQVHLTPPGFGQFMQQPISNNSNTIPYYQLQFLQQQQQFQQPPVQPFHPLLQMPMAQDAQFQYNMHQPFQPSLQNLMSNILDFQPFFNQAQQQFQTQMLFQQSKMFNQQQYPQFMNNDLMMQQQQLGIHPQANYHYANQMQANIFDIKQANQAQYNSYTYQHDNQSSSFFQQFDREIQTMQALLKSKLSKTEAERTAAFKCIESQVQEAYQDFSNVKVQMYGSMATGLAIDSSDMDVLVSGVFGNKGPIDRILLVDQMKKLHKHLNTLFCIESNSMIETASVPVIKIVIDLQKIRESENIEVSQEDIIDLDMKLLKIDITFNQEENDQVEDYNGAQPVHMGLKCCDYLKNKLRLYRNLEPLIIILKKFLALRNLNAPFLGGLSSYGLILLIIAFINSRYQYFESLQVSRVLTEFLQFYGLQFNPTQVIINEHTQFVHLNYSQMLVILDPLNPLNNIGKSTFNFDQIRQEFASAYYKVLDLQKQSSTEQSSKESSCDSTLEEAGQLKILDKILFGDTESPSEFKHQSDRSLAKQ